MSAIRIGLSARPTEIGVRIDVFESVYGGEMRKAGHVDYTPEEAAEFASLLLQAMGGRS